MADIYSLCPLGYPRNLLPLGLYQDLLYRLDDITSLSTPNINHSRKTGHRLCLWFLFLGRHPSMTARTMRKELIKALHADIAPQYCWSRRTGRADTSVNLRSIRLASISGGRFGRTMQLTIIAIIAVIKPLTFSYIRMAGQVIYAAHDA
jgi:hypothetical protein